MYMQMSMNVPLTMEDVNTTVKTQEVLTGVPVVMDMFDRVMESVVNTETQSNSKKLRLIFMIYVNEILNTCMHSSCSTPSLNSRL